VNFGVVSVVWECFSYGTDGVVGGRVMVSVCSSPVPSSVLQHAYI
jgi:hypothetical protein